MAAEDENTAEGQESADAKPAKAKGGKKKLILIAGVVLLALAGGGGGYFMFAGGGDEADNAAASTEKKPVAFVDIKEMTINMASTSAERPVYMKVKVSLEVSDPKLVTEIQPLLPRIEDTFQVYMRELRPGDLEGSAGVYRLKEELLRRVNVAVYPSRVDAVLFKEILVQ